MKFEVISVGIVVALGVVGAVLSGGADKPGVARFRVRCGPTVYSDLSGTNWYDVQGNTAGCFKVPLGYVPVIPVGGQVTNRGRL